MSRLHTAFACAGVAGLIAVAAACDTATVANHNWVVTPDVALHRSTGKPLIRATGQCGNGKKTWIAKSIEVNAWSINQGKTLIVNCGSGYPTGSWGMEERPS